MNNCHTCGNTINAFQAEDGECIECGCDLVAALEHPERTQVGVQLVTCESGEKRFYLPFNFLVKCQKCGERADFNNTLDYLSYPTLGTLERHEMTAPCSNKACGHTTKVSFVLSIKPEDARLEE
jgi:hypothetical protein